MSGALEVDLLDPALYREGVPHDLLAEMRSAGAVHRNPRAVLPFSGEAVEFWSVVRHAEIRTANRDWETYSSSDGVGVGPGDPQRRGAQLTSMDPPQHTRMRRLISAGFTPRMVERLDHLIAEHAARILATAADRGDCDFVDDIAYRLPMHVISDIVGIAEEDRSWVFDRMGKLIKAFDVSAGVTPSDRRQVEQELFSFAHTLTEEKRAHPVDDVWTLISQAEIVDDHGVVHRIEGIELEMFFIVLGLAGSETTRNAISQGLLALLDHPDQLAELRTRPALLPSATDEIIRWASPVLYFGRTATRDVEIDGRRIAAGDRVVLWYVSGNRDERAFVDPFRFDIRRSPNPHVSFGGGGPHLCLGANLARREIHVLFRELLPRYDIEVIGTPEWGGAGAGSNVGVPIYHLPVRLTRR